MHLKAVLIDFGTTLAYIDDEGSRRYTEVLMSILREYGYQGSSVDFTSAFDDTIGNSMIGELKSLPAFWKQLFANLEFSNNSEQLIDELEIVRHRFSTTVFRLYSGACRVLAALQQKYRLALVSNCAIGTSDIINDLGLVEYFDCITLSYEVGVRKPDRRIYLHALKCLKHKPRNCIFVADEISDLEGAVALGMKTLLVRQGAYTTHEAKDPNFQSDFECDHISEITRYL